MATKKTASSKKRPSFSAPKLPEVAEDGVVENSNDLDLNETVSVFKDIPDAPAPPRMIIKEGKGSKQASSAIPEPPADMIVKDEIEVDEPTDTEDEESLEDEEMDVEELLEEADDAEEDLETVLDDINNESSQEAVDGMQESKLASKSISIPNLILLVTLFLFGSLGWMLYLNERGILDSLSFTLPSKKEVVEEVVIESEVLIEDESSTTVVEQLKRSDIKLEILNGSGVSGAAGRQQDIFTTLGYENIEVGNADETEGNELYVHPDFIDQIDILLSDVKDELDIATPSGELDQDSKLTAQIVLGS